MSRYDVEVILKRIEVAPKRSPIAVFADDPNKEYLNAVFGSTSTSKKMIAENPHFIGSFHKDLDLNSVRITLAAAENALRNS